eukprot:gene10962-14722_t
MWWVILFCVLPIGVRSQEESGEVVAGTDPGAPVVANIKQKLIWTTAITSIVWTAFALLLMSGWPHDGQWHVFAAIGEPPCCTCEAERRLCTCETGLSLPRKCLMAFPPRTFAPRLTCSSAAFFRFGGWGVE